MVAFKHLVAIIVRLRVEIKTGLEEMKARILANQEEMKANETLKGQNGD
jgi:hypothetical protein